MLTTLTLACIEVGQGFTIAAFEGLEIVRKHLTKTERKREQAKRMAASVQRDLERITTT